MKKYLTSYLYHFSIILISTIIFTIINYFTNYTNTIIKIIIPVLSLFISTIILGKKTNNMAYLEGIKFTTLYLIIMIIINYLILKNSFDFKIIIFYLLLLFTGTIGSMIGINLKRK